MFILLVMLIPVVNFIAGLIGIYDLLIPAWYRFKEEKEIKRFNKSIDKRNQENPHLPPLPHLQKINAKDL